MPINDVFIEADTDAQNDNDVRNFFIYLLDELIQNSEYTEDEILDHMQTVAPSDGDVGHEVDEIDSSVVHSFILAFMNSNNQEANAIITNFSSALGIEDPSLFDISEVNDTNQQTQIIVSNNRQSFVYQMSKTSNYYSDVENNVTLYSDTSPENSPEPFQQNV